VKKQEHLQITSSVTIPVAELSFTFSRSSGSGGQHVNKVNSRVTLWFDLEDSPSLTLEQKSLVKKRLAARINNRGLLRLDADRRRSQGANRDDAVSRFASLLRDALFVAKTRRKTKPSRGARKRRLQAKKHRSRLKKQRSGKNFRDD
jgi:ribosome-associated protein